MTKNRIDLSVVDTSGGLTLTVGWRSGTKLQLGRLEIGADIDRAFREVIAASVEDIRGRDEQDWSPDADLVAETYLVISADRLGEAPVLASSFGELKLNDVLSNAQTVPTLHARDLPAADLVFYALTIDAGADERVTFLRRSNPRRGLRRGPIYAGLGDALTRVEQPLFTFDGLVDLIFVGDEVAVLSATAFAALFRDQETLAAQVPTWVGELRAHLPIAADSADRLVERTLRDSRLKTRLEAIVVRGHLEDVTEERLREAMRANNLDEDTFMNEAGELTFDDADVQTVLYFLNEDLFYGSITEVGFRADRKATR